MTQEEDSSPHIIETKIRLGRTRFMKSLRNCQCRCQIPKTLLKGKNFANFPRQCYQRKMRRKLPQTLTRFLSTTLLKINLRTGSRMSLILPLKKKLDREKFLARQKRKFKKQTL